MYFVHVYIKKKIQKKFKISKSFPKKRKIFKLKKKKFFELGALDFLLTFFKKGPFFFLSKISRFFKIFFSKWYMDF